MAGSDPFLVSVNAWIDKALDRQDRVIRLTAEMALQRIKELTPVQTGNLRANWAVMRGTKAEAVTGITPRPEDSENTILTLKAGDFFTIVNPAVYAARVNYGFVGTDSLGRHYDQKGVHMVEQVAAELPDLIAKATAIVQAEN